MFRKLLIPLSMLCAAATLAAPSKAPAATNATATGGGHFVYTDIETRFSFNGILQEDGTAFGHAVFDSTRGTLHRRVQVDIDCVDVRSPYQAVLSGIITQVKSTVPEDETSLPGKRIVFAVEDQGEGRDAPDGISFPQFVSPDFDCHTYQPNTIITIDQGNIQVQSD